MSVAREQRAPAKVQSTDRADSTREASEGNWPSLVIQALPERPADSAGCSRRLLHPFCPSPYVIALTGTLASEITSLLIACLLNLVLCNRRRPWETEQEP